MSETIKPWEGPDYEYGVTWGPLSAHPDWNGVCPPPAVVDLCDRLCAMYSHRGDGLPTQLVNPDGPDAAALIMRLVATTPSAFNKGAEG